MENRYLHYHEFVDIPGRITHHNLFLISQKNLQQLAQYISVRELLQRQGRRTIPDLRDGVG